MRAECRIGVITGEVGRCDHKLKAFSVSRGGSVALIHITAADPFCARGDADLIAGSVVADHCTDGV